jgi:hypothetical protein
LPTSFSAPGRLKYCCSSMHHANYFLQASACKTPPSANSFSSSACLSLGFPRLGISHCYWVGGFSIPFISCRYFLDSYLGHLFLPHS